MWLLLLWILDVKEDVNPKQGSLEVNEVITTIWPLTDKKTGARQASELPTGGRRVNAQAHLVPPNALSCFGELGSVTLAKGVVGACLKEGSDLSFSEAGACQALSHLR